MKSFYIINDSSHCVIWDDFIMRVMLSLPSKPKEWDRPENKLPEGNWRLGCGLWRMANQEAYLKAGIPEPTFHQLPAIFCVDQDRVYSQYQVYKADDALEFFKKHLSS